MIHMRPLAFLALISVPVLMAGAAMSDPQTKLVATPVVSGGLVDQCMSASGPCGQEAANAFCQRIKYASATSFSTAPASKPTVMLGSGEKCIPATGAVIGKPCKALKQVTCVRQVFDKVPGVPKSLPGTNG